MTKNLNGRVSSLEKSTGQTGSSGPGGPVLFLPDGSYEVGGKVYTQAELDVLMESWLPGPILFLPKVEDDEHEIE